MKWIRFYATVIIGTCVAGCWGDHRPALTVTTEALPSPARVGSGEPYLSASDRAVFLSWLEASPAGGHELRFASFQQEAWSEPRVIAHSEHFFVNAADFPSVNTGSDGSLWAHWLERGSEEGYDYGIRITRSMDGGESWSKPWIPHDDQSPTEHGFVSVIPTEKGMGFVWLDGRHYVEDADGSPATEEMALLYRAVDVDGTPGPETILDTRVCDCCQTDAAVSSLGPIAVYRDRSDTEIRDIYITRYENGSWTSGTPIHQDGWEINGCPVNGPAVAAIGDRVAVAWYTGAGDEAAVKVAFSDDGGARFGEPTSVDGGSPNGNVDLLMRDDGSVLVSWLERGSGDVAEIRLRRVGADGSISESVSLAESSRQAVSGFPRMVEGSDGTVLLAWTSGQGDTSQVQLTKVEIAN